VFKIKSAVLIEISIIGLTELQLRLFIKSDFKS